MNRRIAIVSLCFVAIFVVAALPTVAAMTPQGKGNYTSEVRTETWTFDSRAVLTSGVPVTGSLSYVGATQTHTIVVAANALSMYSVLTCGSADFDLYGRLGAAPTTSVYDWRGYTSGGEEVTFASPGAGTWYIMVRDYSGSGSYTLTVTITYGGGGGGTLQNGVPATGTLSAVGASQTWTIAVATSAVSMYSVLTCGTADFDLYGKLGSAPTTSVYDWRGYTSGGEEVTFASPGAGTWYIMVLSYSGTGSYTLTVTITYGTTPPPSNVLQNGVPVTGTLSAVGATYTYTMTVNVNAVSMYSVLTCGTADFDLYGRLGAAPTTTTYDWRGYTSGGEEVTFASPGAGTWYIMVRSYSGTGSYTLTVTVTYGTTPPPSGDGDGIVTKWAVIVGISNYEAISDLSYCDEDATDWYNYLNNVMDYDNIRVLGDTATSNYPVYYALATEYNVKASLTWLAGADADDEVAFITSGHGSGTGTGSSYLCMWDSGSGESGQDGNLYDTELDDYVGSWVASKIFIFVDHCYSGGLIPEIQALSNHANVYMTTTCTQNGYGYDDSSHLNGAWTYYFLEYGLINHFGSSTSTTMEACFTYSLAAYPYDGGDTPQQYDGNTSVGFTL